ncbi:uncharacterized protein LOC107045272 [Diachasma alloeum]|uniref:uncharacterized protein LOC107045272 n=1 Tax=Diachasma alloeum TaxID=454923 RepID=UPI0007383BAC|nr:uncharacterized protein LOC107045272 [Diachasma alloeum]
MKKIKIMVNSVLLQVLLLCLLIFEFPCNVNGVSEPTGICSMSGCNCSIVVHHWITVKCIFSEYEDVELQKGSIPEDASEVSVSRCRELKIHSGAFRGGAQLKRVHVTGIRSFVAKQQAFENITAPNPLLEISECTKVVLESHAFKNARGTLSVLISKCRHVEIKPNAFSWLLRFTVKEVPTLELSSNAFKFEAPPYGRHGPATKIMFQSVRISELPSLVFPSAAAEIRMDDVWMRVIRKDAFCPMMILSIKITNASIFEIEPGAFSDQTLIPNLELVEVRLKTIKTGAFRAAFTNFSIQYSRINEIEEGAIDSSIATATFNNNEFQSLRKNAVTLRQWSKIAIDENLFVELAEEAIVADDIAKATAEFPNNDFSFRGNRISRPSDGSLRFVSVSERVTYAKVGNNFFEKVCSCVIEDWMRQVSGKNTSTSWMMDSSFCVAGEWLKKCFKAPQGYLAMRNFTNTFCTPKGDITCKEPSETSKPSVSPPSVGPHVYPRLNSYFDVEMSDPEQLEREKRLIIIVCVVAVLIVVGVIFACGIVYMRRRGVCPKLISRSLNFSNSWLSPSNGITAATSARSISRLSINEYAGLHPEARTIDLDEQTIIHENDVEDFTYTENKATQTLPEELTEEYLKELRERLNDPENYSQARDMIEHLYDLIKVEENCNNNNSDRSLPRGEENAYDIIAPRVKRTRNVRPSVNVGTRAPSLEKLLPPDSMMRPAIADYMEPRDQRTCDLHHLYAELPGDETVPSTSRLSQTITFNLAATAAAAAARAPHPLPPDVVNDHLIDENRQHKYANPIRGEGNPYRETTERLDGQVHKEQQRPLTFLKTLGESILGTKHKRPVNSLLCEYTSPNDLSAHLYSELRDSKGVATSTRKMANRPLPNKPDQDTQFNSAGT